MTPLEKFREEIEAAIEALESSASTFGRTVAGDPGFVFGLRNGREPRLSTMERVRRRTAALLEARAAGPGGVEGTIGTQDGQVPGNIGSPDLSQQEESGSDHIATATRGDGRSCRQRPGAQARHER